jgi:peptidyl-dipeptidase Dcp
MRYPFRLVLAVCLGFLFAFGSSQHSPSPSGLSPTNPFYRASTLAFQAPPFELIHDSDYQPALEAGIALQQREFLQIAGNPEKASFDNTVVALEKSGQLLTRVSNVFYLMAQANTDAVLKRLQELIAPKLASLQDDEYLNAELFRRIESIYEARENLHLDKESKKLIEYYYLQFVRAGARLSDPDKASLKKLNQEDALLSAKFTNQLLQANTAGALLVQDSAQLKGLSPGDLKNYAQYAEAKNHPGDYLLPLQNTTQQPAFGSLESRGTRQKLFESSWNRAEKGDSNDTRAIILRLAAIRSKKASLLGYSSYAAWMLQDQMAKTPEAVTQFLAKLEPAVAAKTKMEASEIQTLIDQGPGGFTLQPWDWSYYSEKVRKAKFNLDENAIKPYFELNQVLEKGVLYAARMLYGLSFSERHDIPVYQSDVRVFEVFDGDHKPIGLIYFDYFRRDNKNGGAWMSNLVGQSALLNTKPVVYNICNFNKPAPGSPALISFDDVTTMFHEFGHALHGLFANQKYPSLSGTAVARDYVEFPSQFNEHWALDPIVLKHYALHYRTKQPIPPALLGRIKQAATFNSGFQYTELLAASLLDIQWHEIGANQDVRDVDQFEKSALDGTGLDIAQVPPRYRSTYFLHIWSNGYAAGYYAYQWTKMLSEDAFSWFQENGGLTRANGQRFRDMILSKGNTEDYNLMFRNFRGHDPDIKAMQQALGLPTP